MSFFTEKIAKAIGSFLGDFIRIDKKNFDGTWKSFMRIRVLLDITKPLKRKMKIMKEGEDWIWIDFKYERLPNFCFLCGLIGHTERFCQKMFEGVTGETERPYGSLLRATGQHPAPSSGNPWLVDVAPRRPGTSVTCPQEVEMMDSDGRTYGEYEISGLQSTDMRSGQGGSGKDSNVSGKGKDKVEGACESGLMGLSTHFHPGIAVGLNEYEQKRKRGDEPKLELLKESSKGDIAGSNFLPEVGPVSQAHLAQ